MAFRNHSSYKILKSINCLILTNLFVFLIYIFYNNDFKLRKFLFYLIFELLLFIFLLIIIFAKRKMFIIKENKVIIKSHCFFINTTKIIMYKSLRYNFKNNYILSLFNICHGTIFLDNKRIDFYCQRNMEYKLKNYFIKCYYNKTEKN